jgi:predicted ArsR family transcriptional regulator
MRVASLRKDHNIAVYREGERAERGEVTLDEAAEALAISQATVRRLIAEGALPARTSPAKGRPGPFAPQTFDAPKSLTRRNDGEALPDLSAV